MKILQTYERTLRVDIENSKQEVCARLGKLVKAKLTRNDVFEISLKPTTLDAFAPRGTVIIEIVPNDKLQRTTLIFKTISNTQKSGYYFLGFVLLLWSLSSLIYSVKFSMIMTIVFGWLIVWLVLYMSRILNQGKLDNYVDDLIRRIR